MEKIDFYKRIMDLNHIGQRIRVSPRRLSWCICEATNEDGETNISPCVAIRDSALLYNLRSDRLEAILNTGRCRTITHDAHICLTDSGYLFYTDQNLFVILLFRYLDYFKGRVYNQEIESMAQRLC